MPAWVASPVHRKLILAIVKARTDAGLSQRDLARKIGKTHSFVGKVESIERNLSVLEFLAIAQAVGTPPQEILRDVMADLPPEFEI